MSAILPAGPWDTEQPRRKIYSARMRVYMAARRAAFRSMGCCIDCGKPIGSDFARCLDHRLANAARVARAHFKKSLR